MHSKDGKSYYFNILKLVLLVLILVNISYFSKPIDSEEPMVYSSNLDNQIDFDDFFNNSSSNCSICSDLSIPSFIESSFEYNAKTRVIFSINDSYNKSIVKSYLLSLGLNISIDLSNSGYISGFIDKNLYDKIKNLGDILTVYPDNDYSVFLDESLPLIGFDEAYNNYGLTGSGKKICILDTGVDSSVVDYSYGYDFVENDLVPDDDYGHGTSVASIIKSIAPDVELVVAKVIGGNGISYESTVLEGLEWCIKQNPDVISFSIGSIYGCNGICDSNPVVEMCNSAVESGIFVVAASGNNGDQSICSPACGRNIFSVGATDDFDNIASFSNVNPTLDCLAPGVNISTNAGIESGTSMSTPHVSACAVLLLENENLNPNELGYRFKSTGKKIFYRYNDSLLLNISRINLYNAINNNITMYPYDYSNWWQCNIEDEIYTSLYDVTVANRFTAYDDDIGGEQWETNPEYMVDGNTGNYARTTINRDVELLTETGFTGGENLGDIEWVHIQAYGDYDGSCTGIGIYLRPVFGGKNDGDDHTAGIGSSAGWGDVVDITNDTNAPDPWGWSDLNDLDLDVEGILAGICDPGSRVKCSLVRIYVGYNAPPDTSIDNIPDPANSNDVSEITGGSTDAGAVSFVNLSIKNETDGKFWNGSEWINVELSYLVSATAKDEIFDSGDEDWVYSPNFNWEDGKQYIIGARATDDDGAVDPSPASITFNYTTNTAPTVDYKTPENLSTNINPCPAVTCEAYVNDSDGDNLNVTWATNAGGIWENKHTNNSVTANSTVSFQFSDFDDYDTTFYWKVYVDDGNNNISETYQFTTEDISTNINSISPYEKTSNPLTITASGDSCLDNVTLWYRYSNDNSSWGGESIEYETEYYFNGYDEGGEEWESNPDSMVDDDDTTSSRSRINGDVQLLNGNNYSSNSGTIKWVHLKTRANYGGSGDIILRPVFEGSADGENYEIRLSDTASWYTVDITNDTTAPSSWTWNNISNLDCDVEAINDGGAVYCFIVQIIVGYETSGSGGGWMQWEDETNPDQTSPWQWDFNFLNGTGYYEFYSIGKKSDSISESAPATADSICYYDSSGSSNIPQINSFGFMNSTGSKIDNSTGLLDVNNEYMFSINITDDDGWNDIEFINITSWYDFGDDTSNYNDTSGGNINMFLQYENKTGNANFSLLWPDDEVEIVNLNCTETIVDSNTKIINISFIPKSQVRWANSNESWVSTEDTYDDPYSWNFNITITDSSNNVNSSIGEYGIYRYTSIIPDTNVITAYLTPGSSAETDTISLNYSSNYDYKIKVFFEEDLTNKTSDNTISIAGNLVLLADGDASDDIEADQTYEGISEINAIEIINNSGVFSNNGNYQTVDVKFSVFVPLGTITGIYTTHINSKITQK